MRALVGVSALYGVTLAALSCLHTLSLRQFYSQDPAFFTQLSWSVAHGHGFRQTIIAHERASGLLDLTHFVPGLAIWSPLQWVFPGPFALQGLQGMLWGLGLIPLVRLCAAAGGHKHWGWFGGALYVLHPLGIGMAMMDFRAGTIAVPLLLFCLDALRRQRPGAAVVFGLIAASGREDVVVTLAALAPLSWALADRSLRARLEALFWPVAIAGAWAAVVVAARGSLSSFAGSGHLREALRAFEPSDGMWKALPLILTPALPTALLAPEALAPLGAVLFGVYVLAQRTVDPSWDIGFHYFAPFAPLLIVGACLGAARLLRWARRPSDRARWGLMAALVVCGVLTTQWSAPNTQRVPTIIQHHRNEGALVEVLLRMVAQVPDDAAVMANARVLPLLAARAQATWPDTPAGALYVAEMNKATWALIAVEERSQLNAPNAWRVIDEGEGYLLLTREQDLQRR